MLFYFGALGIMPIAQALAGLFASPIFVLLFSWGLLGHQIGPWRILAVAIGFLGTLLVLRPNPADLDPLTLLPVAGGAFYAISAMITRHRCAHENPITLLMAMFATLGGMGAIGLLFVCDPEGNFLTRGMVWPMWDAAPYIVLQACGSLIAVFGIIRAYQWGEPTYVAVFEYSVMVFGPLYGWWMLGQQVTPIQGAGIGLIASAGAIIALRSR
jgi:drug/metabolite transporter (DMT)-like permease